MSDSRALADPPDPRYAASLGRWLRHIGYSIQALRDRLGLPQPWLHLPACLPLELSRLDPADPLDAALRVLFLSQQSPLGIPPEGRSWRGKTCPFVVHPYRDLLLASDPPGPRGNRLSGPRLPLRDRVFPVDASTHLLASSLVPSPGSTALDVGCGTGAMSLLLARRCRVTAIDINPRCVAFAKFNAALNETSAVEVLEGDLAAPVRGRRFAHVVANLPYIPTPGPHALYWDGGRRGQDLAARLAGALDDLLEPGGFAQFSLGLPNPQEENWMETLGHWLGRDDLSVLVLHGPPQSMEQAIPLLATSEADTHEKAYWDAVLRWQQAARSAAIREVAPAVAVVRRDGLGERLSLPIVQAADDFGEAILRLFNAWEWLHQQSPGWDAWSRIVLQPGGLLRTSEDVRWDGRDWRRGTARVRFDDRPWQVTQPLGRDSLAAIHLFEGLRPVQDVVFAFAATTGRNPAVVRRKLLEALPSWIRCGLLQPVS